ncbi:hypothetical protein D3C85_1126620 [compost metagenome]
MARRSFQLSLRWCSRVRSRVWLSLRMRPSLGSPRKVERLTEPSSLLTAGIPRSNTDSVRENSVSIDSRVSGLNCQLSDGLTMRRSLPT